MKKWRPLATVLGALGVGAVVWWLHTRPIPTLCTWDRPALVTVCPDAPRPFHEVALSIDWANRLGTRFDGPIAAACDGEPSRGEVWIYGQPPGANEHGGHTSIDYDMKRIAIRARVYVSHEERVLEHELLHAACLGHRNERGHIMHERLADGGWELGKVREALAITFGP